VGFPGRKVPRLLKVSIFEACFLEINVTRPLFLLQYC